jgi:hypothetical protein
MAGGLIQCPRCGRLNDVPTLDEVKNINEDGTYRIDLAPLPKEPDRIDDLKRVYSKTKVDEAGEEIDLRPTREDIARSGATDIPLRGPGDREAPIRPAPPKYDPVTGELIRPMDIIGDPTMPADPSQIPLARATLAYARPDVKKNISAWRPLLHLLRPINIAVMIFVLVVHIFLGVSMIPLMLGYLIIGPLILAMLAGLIGHYANVIEEIGCEERDELPRLFRHVSFVEDIWTPLVRILVAFAFSYAPSLLALTFAPPGIRNTLAIALAGLGTIFFPAALLTTVTSGNLSNMRPDRVMGIVALIGIHYVLILGLFVAAVVIYAVGIAATALNFAHYFVSYNMGILSNGFVAYGFLLAGIYLMHAFSWYLGLVYRAHHDSFPWAHQRFIRTSPRERVAVNQAQQATAKHQRELNKISRDTARRVGY